MNTAQIDASGAARQVAGDAARIIIVLPTRNRAELAIATISSLLHQLQPNTLLIVSDNSTKGESREALCQACQTFNSPAVRYQTPSQPLPMAEHWEWAIDRALHDRFCPTHVMIATDRMLFYRSALTCLRRVLSGSGDSVVCYNNDSLVDVRLPVRLERRLWSGIVVEVPTSQVLSLSSRMEGLYHVPRLLNCVVPARVIRNVRDTFGDVCTSLSPDYAFGYRCLAMEKSIKYFDRSLVLFHAHDRSNGTSMSRGMVSPDSADFVATHGGRLSLSATPAPGVVVGTNAMIHEYCLAKAAAPANRFPELNLERYFSNLEDQLECMDNLEVKATMSELLRLAKNKLLGDTTRARESLLAQGATVEVRRPLGWMPRIKGLFKSSATKPAWFFLADRFGIQPPNYIDFEFSSREKAVEFAQKFPLPRQHSSEHLKWLLGASGCVTEAPVA